MQCNAMQCNAISMKVTSLMHIDSQYVINPSMCSEESFWPLTTSITSEVINDHAHVATLRILNKFIEVNFLVGSMVWPWCCWFQDWTTMSLINKIEEGNTILGKDCISSPKMKNGTILQKVKNQWNNATAFSYYVIVKTL